MKRRASEEGIREPGQEATREAAFGLPRPGPALTALTTSALALPGIAGSARADAPIERATSAASFSYYREDKLSPSRFDDSTGSRERFEVYTGQARFDIPTSKRTDLGIDLLYEEMSGASPWYVRADTTPGSGGKPIQVMSGATIEDRRFDLALDLDFYMDSGKDTLSGGLSIENDYRSLSVGIGTERGFNDRNTTLSLSAAASFDEIFPTDPELSTARPAAGEKWSVDLFAGISQILSRASTLALTVNYKHSDGYLSDPYKAITDVASTGIFADVRPDTKDQASFLLRYRHHIESITASVHGDYRFYVDDWGVVSHTVELAWYQNLFQWLTITPSVRWYSQSKADFYEAVLPAGVLPSERSSDFRLSPYGAVAWKLKADVELVDLARYQAPRWLQAIGISEGLDLIGSISYERYFSDGDFGLVDVDESEEAPGLVRFRVVAITLTGRF